MKSLAIWDFIRHNRPPYVRGASTLLTIDTAWGGQEIRYITVGIDTVYSVVGIAFTPDGRLFGISDPSPKPPAGTPGKGELLEIEPETGKVKMVAKISPTVDGIECLAAPCNFPPCAVESCTTWSWGQIKSRFK